MSKWSEGSAVRQWVRCVERELAIQNTPKRAKTAEKVLGNGALMADDGGEWAFDGRRAVERWWPGGTRSDSRRRQRTARSVLNVLEVCMRGTRQYAGCSDAKR